MSKIGHNNPPQDRKVEWKSISVNIWSYKDLQRIGENILQKKNCFRLLNGDPPLKKLSIPYVIDVLITDKIMAMNSLEIQDNGRNIWEQTEKKLLRTYNSKGGLKLKKNEYKVLVWRILNKVSAFFIFLLIFFKIFKFILTN